MVRLFNALASNPENFLNAHKGAEFEDRIQAFMRGTMKYSRISPRDIEEWSKLRTLTLMKSGDSPIANSSGIDSAFIYQPNGSQNYPDFLVVEADEVVCIETKYTRPPRPVWNSGLPRPNGFYILGTPRDHAIREKQDKFNDRHMSGQSRGFAVYIRKTFGQGKQYNKEADIDYYCSPNRARLERNVLNYFGNQSI